MFDALFCPTISIAESDFDYGTDRYRIHQLFGTKNEIKEFSWSKEVATNRQSRKNQAYTRFIVMGLIIGYNHGLELMGVMSGILWY